MKSIICDLIPNEFEGTPEEIVDFLNENLKDSKIDYEVYIVDQYTRTTNTGGIHGDFCKFMASSYTGVETENALQIYRIEDIDIYTAEEYEGSLNANSGASVYDEDPDMKPEDDYMIIVTVKDTGEEKKNHIKMWRDNACITQAEMAYEFEIPKRTIENWEQGVRQPSKWIEKLIVEKLMQLTETNLVERARKRMNAMKSDEDGNRPVGSWALIMNKDDEFVELYDTMQRAIDAYETFKKGPDAKYYNFFHVAYVITNKGVEGSCYEDREGTLYTDYDSITL